jgi:bifunctional non-homologous end joining protein LigD
MAKRGSAAPAHDDHSIERYKTKRDFTKTPEPAAAPAVAAAEPGRRFVVQRHEARRLHYDLRLEMDGVLKSWAVPKGFSYVPEDKHLAVRTEDHPVEYLAFDGVIPKGEYGAGTMVIWDAGTYELVKSEQAALDQGKLEFRLFGTRLRGEWHMVKTRGEKDWLLFKHRDRYARGADDVAFALDLSLAPSGPLPDAPRAMWPGATGAPFSDDDWLYEMEYDGRRLLARIDGDAVDFFRADGTPAQVSVEGLVRDLRKVRAQRAVLDGVLVAVDAAHKPNRALLDERLAAGTSDGLSYYVFDVLHVDDWDVRGFAQELRKRAAESLVPSRGVRHLAYSSHVVGTGTALYEAVTASGLPGVIAKRRDAPYEAGASDAWRTIPAGQPLPAEASAGDRPAAGAIVVPSRVKVSNREKVFWPGEGITKGDLLDYYDRIAEYLLPHLRDRPIHLLRYPDGITGKAFYQKDVTQYLPDWVPTAVVAEKDGQPVRYAVCNDRDTLLFLVNLGSIDLHPWMSRTRDLDSPDYAIVDLDPPGLEAYDKAVRIAMVVGRILRGAGMRPVIKTSGKEGIHIAIPLRPGYTYDQARMFCELVARMTVGELREIATIERSVGKRGAKVYVDYLQNAREQTVVPPYVVRPVPGATVSTPLDWDELAEGVDPTSFTIANVPDRVRRLGDLFRGVLDDPQDIAEALARLG